MISFFKRPVSFARARYIIQVQRRFKKTKTPTVTNKERALEYFDISYPPIYGARWPSIRLALLSKRKYISVVNTFTDYENTIQQLEELGAMDLRPLYNLGVERHKERIEKWKRWKSQSLAENESEGQSIEESNSGSLRPSLIELDDDEMAAREARREIERYPEEYRQRALAQGSSLDEMDIDFSTRIIKSSQVGTEAALFMDYVPPTKLKGLENWVEETDVFHQTVQEEDEIGMKKEIQEEPLMLPETLKIYHFLRGDICDFPHPRGNNALGVLDQYILDGASLVPVLALDIQQDDKVLDMCAAPGGKSLIALQTCLPSLLVCNDLNLGRVRRLYQVITQYVPKSLTNVRDRLKITMENGCLLQEKDAYDKVLVDVPCLADRHSLEESDNSIFSVRRVKERLALPELQAQLLVVALQAVRPGGFVVYSTCTLSPLQNDGAVHLALSRIWQETKIDYSVIDLTRAVEPLSFLYKFGSRLGLRYGQVILPYLPNNYGPMYICKIKRLR